MCLPVCVYSVVVLDCIVLLYQHVCLITINNYPMCMYVCMCVLVTN